MTLASSVRQRLVLGLPHDMQRLIINADDFGLTDGVSTAIIRGHTRGAISSTSVMVCAPGARTRIRRHADEISGWAGVHLQLTGGVPVRNSANSSLTDSDGAFFASPPDAHVWDPEEVWAEWAAQVELTKRLGVEPSHFDSHHGVHRRADLLPVYCELAKTHGLPVRGGEPHVVAQIRAYGVLCPDTTDNSWTITHRDAASLWRLIEKWQEESASAAVLEIVSHPGAADEELIARSGYAAGREEEFAALQSSQLLDRIRQGGIALSSFTTL